MSRTAFRTPHLTFVAAGLLALAGCDSTVQGGGGGAGGGDDTGAGGGAVVVGSGSPSTSAAETVGSGDPSGSTTTSTGTGDVPFAVAGVILPRDEDDGRVDIRLANAPQSCEAPLAEAPCAPGDRWLARIFPYAEDLAVGTYELLGQGAPMYVEDSYDDCSGWGARGWDGVPGRLTIESIDASSAVITIEGAYDDIDGTYDVALCAGVTPAP